MLEPKLWLDPKPWAYVVYSRCGHVNLLACEPHADDREERKSLADELRHYIIRGGWIERLPREKLAEITLDMCSCEGK